ncbi:hypothetical protein ACQCVE_04790 [Metabacillus sp. 113a]|uniref:hypothetical protein n=1 Tax=Metabacillus sp. 113a TaxID=3404706 RepID=UPI003CF8938B
MDGSMFDQAKRLVARAADYQKELESSPLASQLIDSSTPVVWLGNAAPGGWLTVATNPSPKEFIGRDQQLLSGRKARFYIREQGVSMEEYKKDDRKLAETIRFYETYFLRDSAYRSWFGRPGGAKLEGFLNGMGGSFYSLDGYQSVIHSDLFPIATKTHMGRIKQKKELLGSAFSMAFFEDKLKFLNPNLIILQGREHCQLLERHGIQFSDPVRIERYPGAAWQTGFHSNLGIPVLGLHFKPSEQFLGLGGGMDRDYRSHGKYGTKQALNEIGSEVWENLSAVFPALHR